MDNHPYLIFTSPQPSYPLSFAASVVCQYGSSFNATRANFGPYIAGEWSLAVNDCGPFLNNVGTGSRYDGTWVAPGSPAGTTPAAGIGSCDQWNNWDSYPTATKQSFVQLALGNMDAFGGNYFFWTWKTGFSTGLGKIANPMWNYQLGLAQGYMPADPRVATGACISLVATQGSAYPLKPTPTLSSWQTGGAGAGTIAPTQLSAFAWPPASIGSANYLAANLPTYTPTATFLAAGPPPTPTKFPIGYGNMQITIGNGVVNGAAATPAFTPIAACKNYVNPWSGAVAGATPTPC